MPYNINIIVAVDVIKALSEKKLDNSIYLMDDSTFLSHGKGTAHLVTNCMPGQLIKWTCYAIDLQTPLAISQIAFLPLTAATLQQPDQLQATTTGLRYNNPDLSEWTGIVPGYLVPNQPYHYRLQLEMGEGKNSTMCVNTASIMIKV